MSEIENLTVHVLREIRDEIIATRTELRTELRDVRTELQSVRTELRTEIHDMSDRVDARFVMVETTLRDLAEQQRFVVRHLGALTTRDRKIESDVDELRDRVDAIEKRLPG